MAKAESVAVKATFNKTFVYIYIYIALEINGLKWSAVASTEWSVLLILNTYVSEQLNLQLINTTKRQEI